MFLPPGDATSESQDSYADMCHLLKLRVMRFVYWLLNILWVLIT